MLLRILSVFLLVSATGAQAATLLTKTYVRTGVGGLTNPQGEQLGCNQQQFSDISVPSSEQWSICATDGTWPSYSDLPPSVFDANGSARANFGDLGVGSSLRIDGRLPYGANTTVLSQARMTDSITYSVDESYWWDKAEGTTYKKTFLVRVLGGIDGFVDVGQYGGSPYGHASGSFSFGTADNPAIVYSESGSIWGAGGYVADSVVGSLGLLRLEIDVLNYGETSKTVDIFSEMYASVSCGGGETGTTCSMVSSFLNSAVFEGAYITDQFGDVINDVSVTSASGFDYFEGFKKSNPSTVPLPATLPLLLFGALVFLPLRFRRD